MSNESKWWNLNSPQLVQHDIIDVDTSSKISNYFAKLKSKTPIELILISCGILATLCLSGGIISIFAHNWNEYSKGIRVMLSFIPVLLGLGVFGKALFYHANSKVWMECASVFIILMTGSSIALVTMVYNFGGTFEKFLLIWMLTAIPFIYLSNSSLSAILYTSGITWWIYLKFASSIGFFTIGYKDPVMMCYWLLLALVIPHFMRNVKPDIYSIRSIVLGWSLGILLVFGASVGFVAHPTYNLAILYVLLYFLGKYYYPNGTYFWFRPFQTLAIINILILGFMLSYEWYIRSVMDFNHYSERESYGYDFFREYTNLQPTNSGFVTALGYLIPILFTTAATLMCLLNFKKRGELNWAMISFPITIIIGLFMAYKFKYDLEYASWIFNAYLLFFGGFYLYKGIGMKINSLVSMGIFILGLILILRYFDSELGFLTKGLIYLVIGSGFLFFNYWFDKKTSTDE